MSTINDTDGSSYFRQIIKDAVHDLERSSHAYCFTQEQVDIVMEHYDKGVLEVRERDGIFYVNKVMMDKKKRSRRNAKKQSRNIQG